MRSFPNMPQKSVHVMDQVHGTTIRTISAPSAVAGSFRMYRRTDGLVTNMRNVLLIVKTADCVPVILFDRKCGVIAVVHAGWRGTKSGIVQKAVQKMHSVFGSRSNDIRVCLGPAIHACCYECSPQRILVFQKRFGPAVIAQSQKGFPSIDLIQANRIALKRAGVTHIQIDLTCTACSGRKKYFSYRRGDRGVFSTAVVMK